MKVQQNNSNEAASAVAGCLVMFFMALTILNTIGILTLAIVK